ncbi:hypothetical protein AAFF_G00227940 [Aldrovandia affinis]|uniref:Uncharacterized protein n=1 Tax=Aldrovandia affinis TaxID=143900 RepID=A0AAD7TD27_9TELE|nr:hypothetical protein AAFF_G00227940 [Aldrovandia affinis]
MVITLPLCLLASGLPVQLLTTLRGSLLLLEEEKEPRKQIDGVADDQANLRSCAAERANLHREGVHECLHLQQVTPRGMACSVTPPKLLNPAPSPPLRPLHGITIRHNHGNQTDDLCSTTLRTASSLHKRPGRFSWWSDIILQPLKYTLTLTIWTGGREPTRLRKKSQQRVVSTPPSSFSGGDDVTAMLGPA